MRLHKILVVGDTGVGKTALLQRASGQRVLVQSVPTIGVGFDTVDIDGARLGIWDTAGADRFQSLTYGYYRGAEHVLLLYDVTQPLTLTRALTLWRSRLDGLLPSVPVTLVASKLDKFPRYELGPVRAAAATHGMAFAAVSAVTGKGVAELMAHLAASVQCAHQVDPAPPEIQFAPAAVPRLSLRDMLCGAWW